MPYYKIDYGENDESLNCIALIDLRSALDVTKKLEEYRDGDLRYENSADMFISWLNEQGVKAEIVEVSGVVDF